MTEETATASPRMHWKRRRPANPLPPEHTARQGAITQLAFLLLGREAAIAFLNTAHAGLGGRPLDIASASDGGRNSVEAEIGRLAYAAPKHPQTSQQAIAERGREVPGERPERSREPADAHFRHLRDTRNPRALPPDAAGSE